MARCGELRGLRRPGRGGDGGGGAAGAGAGGGGRYLAELAAGLRFVLGDGPIRAIFVSAAVLNALISPLFAVILPVYVQAAHGSAASLGLIVAAFGGGSAAGAVVYGAVGHRLPRRGTFVVGVGAIGAAIAVLVLLPPAPAMAGALALGGLIAGPNGPLVATVLQERTPAALRGRVFGATTAVGFAAAPLGVLLAGALIPAIGVRACWRAARSPFSAWSWGWRAMPGCGSWTGRRAGCRGGPERILGRVGQAGEDPRGWPTRGDAGALGSRRLTGPNAGISRRARTGDRSHRGPDRVAEPEAEDAPTLASRGWAAP